MGSSASTITPPSTPEKEGGLPQQQQQQQQATTSSAHAQGRFRASPSPYGGGVTVFHRQQIQHQQSQDLSHCGGSCGSGGGSNSGIGAGCSNSGSNSNINNISNNSGNNKMDKRSTQQHVFSSSADMYASKQYVLRTNNVAPVIIKDCREEFQQISDLSEPIIKGSMADKMLEHPLIKGKYFLVQDSNGAEDKLQTCRHISAPNFQQASGGQPVFSSGQPTLNGFTNIMKQLTSDGYSDVLVLNLRSEPVLFQHVDEDFVPYSIRHKEHLEHMVGLGMSKDDSDQVEAVIRKQILAHSNMEEDFTFYFYDNLDKLQYEPHMRKVEYEEDVLLSAEIYAREAFSNQVLRYDRICLPERGTPTEEMVDQFLSHFRERPAFLDRNNRTFPAIYLFSHSGGRRSAIAMVMSCLLFSYKRGNLSQFSKVNGDESSSSGQEYRAVKHIVSHLKDGPMLKRQVDSVIDQCSEVINLRKLMDDLKDKLETTAANSSSNDQLRVEVLREELVIALETYCFLIAFNGYLRDQVPNNLGITYSKWLQLNPEVVRLLCDVDFSEIWAPTSLLPSGKRVLVADNYIGLDVLSSQMEVRVSNFRRLMGLPVYGMAQPCRNGLSKVVNHLGQHKQGFTNVLIINLRSDYVLECDGNTYSVRDAAMLAEPVHSKTACGKELEEVEAKIRKEIKHRKIWKVYQEITDPPVEKDLGGVLTPEDLYEQQRLSTLDLEYRRLPIRYHNTFKEQEFDAIQNLITSYMKAEGSWSNSSQAFVFHCRTGKSRTSMAMAVVGLLFYHMTGFPYGANSNEQERVSCPNAAYTKGEFAVVEKLLWKLPRGHQTKREVDLVLDRLFETMSPMHFHLREVIFVVFNKARSSKGEMKNYLHRLSYDYLERYLYLILYNSYLHMEKKSNFERSFSRWMVEVAAPTGVYDILDNLGFFSLESELSIYSRRKNRIRDRLEHFAFSGTFE